MSFIELSADNVILSAIMSGEGGTTIRVFETEGKKTKRVTMKLVWKIEKAFETNLIEKEEKGLQLYEEGKALVFDIQGYEIKTFKLVLKPASAK
jgi:alpha-mannosidase